MHFQNFIAYIAVISNHLVFVMEHVIKLMVEICVVVACILDLVLARSQKLRDLLNSFLS